MREVGIETMKDDPSDRFSIVVAVLAVITTLVAAIIGIQLAIASNHGEDLGSEALRHTILASEASSRAGLDTTEMLRLVEQRRAQATAARLLDERLHLAGTVDPTLSAELAGWRTQVRSTDQEMIREAARDGLTRIDPNGINAPEHDPAFPYRFRADAEREGFEQIALRDAANSAASEWGKRGGSYAALLTLLAVALYLFGFALTPQGRRVRGLFAATGLAFLVVCSIFGPGRLLSSPELAPAEAASAYADAEVTTLTANGPEDYRHAVAAYTRAIELRPGFADAYVGRANALFAAESTQETGTDFISLASPSAIKGALEDYRMARELGVRTPAILANIGFHLFLLGLLEHDQELLGESLSATDDAISGDPGDPVERFNRAVALLASGRVDEARTAYAEALELTLRNRDAGAYADWIAGALTDLELVPLHGDPELLDEAQEIRGLIVGSAARERVSEGSSEATAAEIDPIVEAGRTRLFFDSDGLVEGDSPAVEWYHLDREGIGWANVRDISGPMTLYAYPDGSVGGFANYTSVRADCLPAGEYRTDIYDDGVLIGQANSSLDFESKPFINHDANLIGCIPEAWEGGPESGSPTRAYVSPDGSSGLVVARLDTRDPAPVHTPRQIRTQLEDVWTLLDGEYLGERPQYQSSDRLDFNPGSRYQLAYRYEGGEIAATAARDNDGSVIAAFIFGPHSLFEPLPESPATPQQVLTSIAVATISAVPES